MKRIFEFEANDEKYILTNTNPNEKRKSFEIDKSQMQFNTNEFYEYVFSDIHNETDIEIIDKTDSEDKAAKRICKIVREIVEGVMEKFKEKCTLE